MKRGPLKSLAVAVMGLIGLVYILNPTAGILELIPDAIPFIGNLDEAAAITLILGSLRYFGFDITNFFNKKDEKIDS